MPATDLAKYVALFGEDFAPIVHALEKGLNPNVQAQVLGLLDNMTLKAEIFGAQVQSTVATLSTNGASANTIRSALKADMASGGSIFGSLKKEVKAGIATQVNQSGRIGMMEQYAKVENFQWVTVGTKVCLDCGPRGGTTLTWDQWVSEGLPGSGWSVCKGYCYCILDGSGKLPPEVKMPVVEPRAGKASLIPPKYPSKQTFTKYDDLKTASQNYWHEQQMVFNAEEAAWHKARDAYMNSLPGSKLDNMGKRMAWERLNPEPIFHNRKAYGSYFHSGFRRINEYARGVGREGQNRYNQMIKTFGEQPGYKGTTYRGTGQKTLADFNSRLAVYENNVGGVVTEDMFFSTSQEKIFAAKWQRNRPYRIEFTVEGKTGIAPDGLEISKSEMEVLFNSKSQFEVVSVTKSKNVYSTLERIGDNMYDEIAHVVLKEI